MKIHFNNVKWNCDNKNDLKKLDKEFTVDLYDIIPQDEFDDILTDFISEKYGFCHEGFEYDFTSSDIELGKQFKKLIKDVVNEGNSTDT